MKNTFLKLCLAAAVGALISPVTAHAATATSAIVTLSLPASGPTCTVTNSAAAISMPAATIGQTVASYQALNRPTQTAIAPGNTSFMTSTTLNQTATISCNTANITITGFLVQPGPSAFTGTTAAVAYQFLVDATPSTPAKAAGGVGDIMHTVPEQLSINGNPAASAYFDLTTKAPKAYAVPFTTGAISTGVTPASTATVVWRPYFFTGSNDQSVFTAANGNSYSASFQIVVNY